MPSTAHSPNVGRLRANEHVRQRAQKPAAPAARHLTIAKQRTLLAAPLVLIASMYVVLRINVAWLGQSTGYVAAFALYWLGWGIVFPVWLIGFDGVVDLFSLGRGNRWGLPSAIAIPLLAAPAVTGFLFVFPSVFPDAGAKLIAAIAIYAFVNSVVEETFWRGLFARAFPRDPSFGLLYPAFGFALWQLVPISQATVRAPFGPGAVVALALGTGLVFGWVAWRTGSVRWTAVAHALMNLSGIGSLIIFAGR
jgi:uncharacterized protein